MATPVRTEDRTGDFDGLELATDMPTKTTGRLKIGDQWNAINIIAQSQTHPLKAVCELTENAIDAGGRQIEIVRRKVKGRIFLEVVDDGDGVRHNPDGLPDFAHIATHICDSMKRHLDQSQRQGVHGEFGIGLLSFWSLGEELRMASAGADGKLYEMAMLRGEPKYQVRPVRSRISLGGTRVTIGPLLEATRKIVTGDKLQKYLAAELAGRIRDTGAQIRVTDRVSRKNLDVVPREFDGESLDLPPAVETPRGRLKVELFLIPEAGRSVAEVALCKDGTRVFQRLDELVYFQRSPWTDGRLQGTLDFPTLRLAPGTRSGVVPDEHLDAFIEAVQSIEPAVARSIEQYDRAEAEKASEKLLRQVHKAFKQAIQELPENDYLFFDIPKPAESDSEGGTGLALATPRADIPTSSDGNVRLFPQEPGPLAGVVVSPRAPRRKPGETCRLTAKPHDVEGIEIERGLNFAWRISDGAAELCDVQGQEATVTSPEAGSVIVEVTARQGEREATGRAVILYSESDDGPSAGKGLPSYRLLHEPGSPHRSRYDSALNEIMINSAHRDFLASRSSNAKHRRYVGKLYAKEVVLLNFPHETPENVTERLIEMLVRIEDVL